MTKKSARAKTLLMRFSILFIVNDCIFGEQLCVSLGQRKYNSKFSIGQRIRFEHLTK